MQKNMQRKPREKYRRRKKEQLCAILLELLETKRLDSITVGEICDKAGIHRTTFYNHFNDIYDLLYFCMEQMLKTFENAPASNSEQISDSIIEFIKRYRRVLINLSDTVYRNEFAVTKKKIEVILIKLLNSNASQSKHKMPIPIIIKFCCGGLVELIYYWIEKPEINEDEVREQLNLIFEMIDKI